MPPTATATATRPEPQPGLIDRLPGCRAADAVLVESVSEPGRYRVVDERRRRCSCPGFANRRWCRHLRQVFPPDADWYQPDGGNRDTVCRGCGTPLFGKVRMCRYCDAAYAPEPEPEPVAEPEPADARLEREIEELFGPAREDTAAAQGGMRI